MTADDVLIDRPPALVFRKLTPEQFAEPAWVVMARKDPDGGEGMGPPRVYFDNVEFLTEDDADDKAEFDALPMDFCVYISRTPPVAASPAVTGETMSTRETFNAYYYALTGTGEPTIDAILKEVARAGKGCHNTEDWYEHGYPEAIQAAAEHAAEEMKSLRASLSQSREPTESGEAK